MLVSLLIGGNPTTLQHSYASMMLYRICIIGRTITYVYKSHETSPEESLDAGSIAVLCRTLFDASAMFFYLAEEISDDEWTFRSTVLKVHDTAARLRLFKGYGMDEEAAEKRQHLTTLKAELSKLPLFQARGADEQKKLLSGQETHVNGVRSVLKAMDIGKKHFDGLYNYLSAHVHLTPLSYFRAHKRVDEAADAAFARNFMGLCLREAAQFVVRVALREVELSKLEDRLGKSALERMTRFRAPLTP